MRRFEGDFFPILGGTRGMNEWVIRWGIWICPCEIDHRIRDYVLLYVQTTLEVIALAFLSYTGAVLRGVIRNYQPKDFCKT